MNILTKENYLRFTYTNEELLTGAPRAIVFEFHGLGGGREMHCEHTKLSYFFAEHDIIYCMPFYGPWSWMNKASVNMVDELTEALWDKYGKELPTVSSGYSMGGLAGLIYSRHSKHTPAVCATICPVCDLPYHFTEREDTARTIYASYGGYDMPLQDAMRIGSPIHQAEHMPYIPYIIFAMTDDDQVNYKAHSETFVKRMRELGHTVEYVTVPNRGHCDMDKGSVEKYKQFIIDNLK